MANNTGYVYLIMNNINAHYYIGRKKGEFKPNYWGSGEAIRKAIKKYGTESFTRRILYEGPEYVALEAWLLSTAEAAQDNDCYNLSNVVGPGCFNEETLEKIKQVSRSGERNGFYGKKHTKEARARIKAATTGENHPLFGRRGELAPFYGRKHTDETIQKMRESQSGENNGMYRKTHKPEVVEKMKLSRKGEGNNMYGKKHTPEAIKKIKDARSLQVCSDETRAKFREREEKKRRAKLAARQVNSKSLHSSL